MEISSTTIEVSNVDAIKAQLQKVNESFEAFKKESEKLRELELRVTSKANHAHDFTGPIPPIVIENDITLTDGTVIHAFIDADMQVIWACIVQPRTETRNG